MQGLRPCRQWEKDPGASRTLPPLPATRLGQRQSAAAASCPGPGNTTSNPGAQCSAQAAGDRPSSREQPRHWTGLCLAQGHTAGRAWLLQGLGGCPGQNSSRLHLFPPGLLRATQDASGAWPQPPSLSAGFLPCSPHPVPGALAGAGALCSGGRGAVGGGAGPARPGGGRFRRGELPQTQNRCWQQN